MDMRMREIWDTVISFYIALCNLLSLSLQTYYMYNYQLINFLSFDVCGVT